MSSTDVTEPLFSYGTLQLPAVQTATFGRPLPGRFDAHDAAGFTALIATLVAGTGWP